MSKINKLPGKNDMLLDAAKGWVQTQVVEVEGAYKRAVVLVECSVSDERRFGYFNGTWFRLEEGDSAPLRKTIRDKLGDFDVIECSADDDRKLLYWDKKHWRPAN